MATFLKSHETRNLALSIIASVIAGITTILVAGTYMARKGSEQTIARTMAIQKSRDVQTEQIYGMNIKDVSDVSKRLSVSITTDEFYNGDWNPVLTHTFYGQNEEELENLVQTHINTDSFFAASFKGLFNWKGTEIKLKNSEPKLLYA